jgi:hypothetical protein
MATATSSFFNISNFRAALDAGAKPNLFSINMNLPTGVTGGGVDFQNRLILCKSAAIPALTVGIIEVPYRGRRIKLPGDRVYGDWTITIVNDNRQFMRKSFDRWLKYINNPDATKDIRTTQAIDYKVPIVSIASKIHTVAGVNLKTNTNFLSRYWLMKTNLLYKRLVFGVLKNLWEKNMMVYTEPLLLLMNKAL